jgi:hypothetical protein
MASDIDAVITWVNGSSHQHTASRKKFMAQSASALHENATNPHRWICNDEILFCLQSIHNFAPWTRRIWIVVDDETPDIKSLPIDLQQKITFAFHKQIFGKYVDFLPTFNSLAIESLLWKIDGLAEKFMYFNDDVFLTSKLQPSDVFLNNKPVLRGAWSNYSSLVHNHQVKGDPAYFNHYMQMNAAAMEGFEASKIFAAAHVVHPFTRSKMAALFAKYQNEFIENISYRLRDIKQFLAQSLYNHAAISEQNVILSNETDHIHIHSGQGRDGCLENTLITLEQIITSNSIKFLCINDLPQLEILIPNIRNLLSDAIGGF